MWPAVFAMTMVAAGWPSRTRVIFGRAASAAGDRSGNDSTVMAKMRIQAVLIVPGSWTNALARLRGGGLGRGKEFLFSWLD